MAISPSTKTGLAGSALILAAMALLIFGLHKPITGITQLVVILIYCFFILFSIYRFSKTLERKAGFKAFFSEGFKTFIVMILTIVVFTFIYYKTHPGIMETGIADNKQLLIADGNYTLTEIEANSEKLRSIFMPMMLSVTTILLLIVGAIMSLVGAVSFNKKS